MSLGIERAREQKGHGSHTEQCDRGIAKAVREIDELRAENTKLLAVADRYRQERDAARAEARHLENNLTVQRAGRTAAEAKAAEAEKRRIEIAAALGYAEHVPGYGWSVASHTDLVERAQSLVTVEMEHIECPVWCEECERMERPESCPACKGSGCGPDTASGAYAECELCAGDGREHAADKAQEGDKC